MWSTDRSVHRRVRVRVHTSTPTHTHCLPAALAGSQRAAQTPASRCPQPTGGATTESIESESIEREPFQGCVCANRARARSISIGRSIDRCVGGFSFCLRASSSIFAFFTRRSTTLTQIDTSTCHALKIRPPPLPNRSNPHPSVTHRAAAAAAVAAAVGTASAQASIGDRIEPPKPCPDHSRFQARAAHIHIYPTFKVPHTL